MKNVLLAAIYSVFCFATFSQSTKADKDYLFDKGLFLDGQISYRSYYGADKKNNLSPATAQSLHPNYIGISYKMGNKWYFGSSSKKWRPGFQLTWLKFDIMKMTGNSKMQSDSSAANPPQILDISMFDIGFTNIFKTGEKSGIELNFNTGINTRWIEENSSFMGDISLTTKATLDLNAEIKYRINKFAIGLNYTKSIDINVVNNLYMNTFNLSVGGKF